ncbi:MAG: SOS response-associated peptidase [Shimia sp.]
MPGRFYLTRPMEEVAAWMGVAPGPCAADPPRCNVAPGQQIAVAAGGTLVPMRWGMVPVGRRNARGRPVMETLINARSETVFDKSAFEGVGRALVPADGWYEWTGQARRKTAWRIARADGGLLAFAAITDMWRSPGGLEVPQVATVTCPPNGDVREMHHRMGVLLDPPQFETWLHGSEDAVRGLMAPYPDGRLTVDAAADVDWTAA